MAAPLRDPYPEVELAPPPRALPLVEPRLISPPPSYIEPCPLSPSSCYSRPDIVSVIKTPAQAKRESYNMTGSTYLITNTGKTLKLPVPSNSQDDPLNWSRWKTAGAMFSVAFYSILCLTAAQAASVVLDGINAEFQHENIDPWLLKAIVTTPTMCMGLGCMFWIPLSIGMGRRPTLLIATLTLLAALFGAAEARSFSQLHAAVAFIGLSEGLSLSLAFLMVIDMTFINQRATGVALMWSIAGCLGTSGVALVPLITHEGRMWRCFYGYWMIPVALSFCVSFFFYPETYFKRPTVAFDGMIVLQSATEKLTVYQDVETDSDIYRDLPEPPVRTGFAGFRDRRGLSRSPFASWVSMGRCYLQMGYCVANPLIFWVFIVGAVNSAIQIYIGTTFARILMAPPYNFSRSIVGTVSIATGVGALCAFPTWHFFLCRVITRLSKRNHGVLEAEHYLVGYIMPTITGCISSLIYGMAIQNQWHAAIFYLAYGLNGFSFTTLMIANTLWVAEAFPRWAAPAVAVVAGGANLIGFWMSFALEPWIADHGYEMVSIELLILQLLTGFVALPVAFWGKSARQAIQGKWAEDRSGALRPL